MKTTEKHSLVFKIPASGPRLGGAGMSFQVRKTLVTAGEDYKLCRLRVEALKMNLFTPAEMVGLIPWERMSHEERIFDSEEE